MVGKGRHPILGVWSPDPVLSMVGPIGLAASAGTALIVDMVAGRGDGRRTLDDLVRDGPSLSELSPGKRGIAYMAAGPVDPSAAIELIQRLGQHWPAVVVRVGRPDTAFPLVPVVPLFPGRLTLVDLPARGVWQPVGPGSDPPGPGPVLPALRSSAIKRMLSGQLPRRTKWISAWSRVWEMPWA